MVIQMNVAEAKAKLSELLDAAVAGDEVVVARAGHPVARLVAIDEPKPRQLGFLDLAVDDALFAPLSGVDLHDWDGG